MTAIPALDEDEKYLAALLDDPSGIELAEFMFVDEEKPDRCFRLWDFQWPLLSRDDTYQIDQMGRALGKSMGIVMRAFAFPFNYPGAEMLITAPELNHLRPVTDKVETLLLETRLAREMLPNVKGGGINHQPQFQVRFINGARIISRLPNRDGRGVKGMHPLVIEMDESQNYPDSGWVEIIETMKASSAGAQWRCLGEGQLVLTHRGLVPIEDVKVGDLVWTHRGRWRAVLNVFDNGLQECISVAGRGHPGLVVTPQHEVLLGQLVLPKVGRRMLRTTTWKAIADATWSRRSQDAWASPATVRTPAVPPPMRSVPAGLGRFTPPPVVDVTAPEWLWLYGLYLAQGYGVDFDQAHRDGRVERHRRVAWCVNDVKCDEVADRLRAFGFRPYLYRQGRSVKVVVSNAAVYHWLTDAAGRLAAGKRLASWVFGLSDEGRRAVFDGMNFGDGYFSQKRNRYEYSTVSHTLALGFKLLAQTLGYVCSLTYRPARVKMGSIDDRVIRSGPIWAVLAQLGDDQVRRQSVIADGMVWSPVHPQRDFMPVGTRHVYDLEVAEDHSYVVEGIVVSNCHGVSRGVRDMYYRLTMGESPDLPFYVHRYIGPHRPSWSPEERNSKISLYGGTEDNVDYRRNIFGEHGDAHNPIFVLARLMACVRINESAWATEYNTDIYTKIKVNDELFRKTGLPIEHFLTLPQSHLIKGYSSYWGGMDVGFTNDPTEILVFGVVGRAGKPDLHRLLTRVQLKRIDATTQAAAVAGIFDFYGTRLRRMGLDKTGNGLPLWQLMREHPSILNRIAGYGFSEKKPVEFDDRPLVGRERPQDAVIEKNVIDFATDALRGYVDTGALELPYDVELLSEFQGQSMRTIQDVGSNAGISRRYSGGQCHTLDAARMFTAAKELESIEAILTAPQRHGPVLDQFG